MQRFKVLMLALLAMVVLASCTTSSCVTTVTINTPDTFSCPTSFTDVQGCVITTDIQTKYKGMNVVPNTGMIEFSTDQTVDQVAPIYTDFLKAKADLAEVPVSADLKKIGTTYLGMTDTDTIIAYQTKIGVGFYVFLKTVNGRTNVAVISGALGCAN
jgi:hypothetical protein